MISLTVAAGLELCVIEITDNGSGIPEDRLRRLNRQLRMDESDYLEIRREFEGASPGISGIGLRNVDQRLVMSYGLDSGIRIESLEGSFTRIVMTLPRYNWTGGGIG